MIVSGIPYLHTQTNPVQSLLDKPNQENGKSNRLGALQPERSDGLAGRIRASSCLYKSKRAADWKEPRYYLLFSLETRAVLFHLPISACFFLQKADTLKFMRFWISKGKHTSPSIPCSTVTGVIKYKSTTQFGYSSPCSKIQTIYNGLTKWVISIKYYKP